MGILCVGSLAWLLKSINQVDPRFEGKTLLEARQGHQTRLIERQKTSLPLDVPPANLFSLVHYPAEQGPTPAYLSLTPEGDTTRHPAIVWLFGGFNNSIGSAAWEPASPANDQSARAFRESGLIMMYPALRGGCEAPGTMEGFYGEVNDVLAAADFLAQQPNVDPQRIYLGGHSTGGTLALLCAAASKKKFRAVFSFGPVDRVDGYGQEELPYDVNDDLEGELRDPVEWLHAIQIPTFVIEGANGNAICIFSMRTAPKSEHVHLNIVREADHFDVLDPITRLLAKKVAADTGPTCNIEIDGSELNDAYANR
ncbi:MAG: prolyl oligopeptidase family serine peptidase [Pirellulales bacterium]|nr:prolyl oligopeptidase family serine peptidase [Pirellulales bacterium]